ncbi:lipase family protein [Parafrankia discariae]|uniref:lipase family protein n=1 Tax=Parafrankia discariae TaxID=365528 RepID=UPI00039EE6A3|nr:lipase family protein [Parafrankia discariae]
MAAPAGDAFYIPPKVLPAGDPGDILWSRKVPAAGKLKDANFTVYQVLYLSTDTHDQPVAVSGTIVFPPAGSRADMPLLGFATGTHGLGDDCAPSKSLAAGADDWADILELAASHGWAVAATDYEGLGTPGPHTYAVGRAEGHAVLDAARAALRLREGGLSRNAKVGFWGYSQGGGAASWAGELAPGYAPDLNTVGIAAGGVPADLLKVSAGVDGATWAAVEFMAALGFDAAYSELKLDSFVLPAARASLDQLRTACVKQAVLSFAGKHARDVFTTDPLKSTTWQKRLAENSLGSTPPKVPIFLYHGEKDDVVAFGQAESLERTYCAGGADVTWMPIAGANHDAASYLEAEPVAFLADRFAGNPLASTC